MACPFTSRRMHRVSRKSASCSWNELLPAHDIDNGLNRRRSTVRFIRFLASFLIVMAQLVFHGNVDGVEQERVSP